MAISLLRLICGKRLLRWSHQTKGSLSSAPDAPLIAKKLDCLLTFVVLPDFIRNSSVSANVGGGSEWLNALPIKNCGLLLSDEELQNNVGLSLECDLAVRHECSGCGVEVCYGLLCKMSKGRLSRHSEVNSLIA